MPQQKASDSKQQGQPKQQRNAKERKQDIKNAEYIASIDQPNHPNT